MWDVTALGEVLIDFTPEGKNRQEAALFACNPGGAPANVLAMCARLGGRAALIGKVGADSFGDLLRRTLRENGVDVGGLVTDSRIPTTLAFVHLDEGGERSFTFYRKPGADLMLTFEEVDRERIDGCRIFHFGSVSLTGEPARTAAWKAAARAKAQGKQISFDPNYRPFLWENREEAKAQIQKGIALADLVKVSEEELFLAAGTDDWRLGSKYLLEQGPSLVLVSLGEKGAFYRNRAGFGLVPAWPVKTTDTTGAGDAFWGAMLWQLRKMTAEEAGALPPETLEEMVAFANAAGGLTTEKKGAIPALPSKEEIRRQTGRPIPGTVTSDPRARTEA